MTLHFYLTNPKSERSSIRVTITHKGKQYNKCIGESVLTKDWLQKSERSRDADVNRRLREVQLTLLEEIGEEPTEKLILKALGGLSGSKTDTLSNQSLLALVRPSFYEYFESWSNKPISSIRQHQLAFRKVFEIVGKKVDWEDLDDSFYFRLCQGMASRGYSINYQGNIISRVRTVISEGRKLHYHTNDAYLSWKKPHEEAFSIALNPSEMEAIWTAEGLTDMERKARDLAWVGYLTAARFSDYSRLSYENIVDGKINFVQEKTDAGVLIPCAPRVYEVLDRNGGRVPVLASANFNLAIKRVCRKAGICGIIQVPESKRKMMGWSKTEKIEKWMLVSSHTFRRSGATALYKSGVPVALCCKVTGHKKSEQFLRYCKISREEAAEELAKLEFFK